MDPETALGFHCLSETFQQTTEQTTFVVTGT